MESAMKVHPLLPLHALQWLIEITVEGSAKL